LTSCIITVHDTILSITSSLHTGTSVRVESMDTSSQILTEESYGTIERLAEASSLSEEVGLGMTSEVVEV